MDATRDSIEDTGPAFGLLGWAWGFYLRHLTWIVGLSLIVSAQRVVSVLWGHALPPLLNLSLEGLTAVVRLFLLVLVARLAWAEWTANSPERPRRTLRQHSASLLRHRRTLVTQLSLLLLVSLLFKVVPELLIAPLVPTSGQKLYTALLLAIKNPTIIAFTSIWIIGMARLVLLAPLPEAEPCREGSIR